MDGTNTALWSAIATAAPLATAGVDAHTPAPARHIVTAARAKTVDVQMIGDATGY